MLADDQVAIRARGHVLLAQQLGARSEQVGGRAEASIDILDLVSRGFQALVASPLYAIHTVQTSIALDGTRLSCMFAPQGTRRQDAAWHVQLHISQDMHLS